MATLALFMGTTKTGENVSIRCAETSDAPQLVALMSEVIAEGTYTLAEPDEWTVTPEQERESIAEHTEQPGYLYLVATVDTGHGQTREWSSTPHRPQWHVLHLRPARVARARDWEAADRAPDRMGDRACRDRKGHACGLLEQSPRAMKLWPGEYLDSVLMYRFVKPVGDGTHYTLPVAAHE